jgi:hypothetical protein
MTLRKYSPKINRTEAKTDKRTEHREVANLNKSEEKNKGVKTGGDQGRGKKSERKNTKNTVKTIEM